MRKLVNVANDGVIFINCLRSIGKLWYKLKHWGEEEEQEDGNKKVKKGKRGN